MLKRTYRSIFLSDDWAHQRYLGWQVVHSEPCFRVLSQRRSVVKRFLVLLGGEERGGLDNFIRKLNDNVVDFNDIILHDFDNLIDGSQPIGGVDFSRVAQTDCLLNVATFVIDLQKSEDILLSAMSSDYRRKIKKAESAGVSVEVYSKPDSALLSAFFVSFADFIKQRRLKFISLNSLASMYADGRALLFVARKEGAISNYLHLYKAGDAAIFMYGVNISKVNDGAGQYLHWQAMRRLKAEGVGWYDLGGVPTVDPSNGIYNFKEKFGGALVRLGSEWRHTGLPVTAGLNIVRTLKHMSGRNRG